MMRVIALAVTLLILVGPARVVLVRARWTERAPRTTIVLWQAVGCGVAIAFLGACIDALLTISSSNMPRRRPVTDFTANSVPSHAISTTGPIEWFALAITLAIATYFVVAVAMQVTRSLRRRARHRLLIDLLSTERPDLSGALVLPHPYAAAFSLPGLHPRIVISTGALDTLSDDELAAVLVHERAHVRARHDLVLLPFLTATLVLPWSRALARVREEVSTLVEMAADDQVLRSGNGYALVRVLNRLAGVATSPVEHMPADERIARRIDRALAPRRGARLVALSSALFAGTALALPLAVIFLPLSVR